MGCSWVIPTIRIETKTRKCDALEICRLESIKIYANCADSHFRPVFLPDRDKLARSDSHGGFCVHRCVGIFLLSRKTKRQQEEDLKMKFELQGHDHITLNNLLKVLHLVGTGGEANIRISNGEVWVNGAVETQKRKKLRAGDVVQFQKNTIDIR